MEEVEVRIGPDGTVQVKVHGVKGTGCEALTDPLEHVLGGQVISKEYTEEYYQSKKEEEQKDKQVVFVG
jgi:hypothetical protein